MREILESACPSPVFRGHHLICLNFYNGEGYSTGYIEHLSQTLAIAEKEAVKICVGADCICKECPNLCDEKCECYENAEADIRCMDATALDLLGLSPDTSISWKEVREKIGDIFHEWYGLYCKDCNWISACRKNESFGQLIPKSR
jgi:hypothetical protein